MAIKPKEKKEVKMEKTGEEWKPGTDSCSWNSGLIEKRLWLWRKPWERRSSRFHLVLPTGGSVGESSTYRSEFPFQGQAESVKMKLRSSNPNLGRT